MEELFLEMPFCLCNFLHTSEGKGVKCLMSHGGIPIMGRFAGLVGKGQLTGEDAVITRRADTAHDIPPIRNAVAHEQVKIVRPKNVLSRHTQVIVKMRVAQRVTVQRQHILAAVVAQLAISVAM